MCEKIPVVVKESMRERLKKLAENNEKFQPRAGQNIMFAEVTKTIFGAYSKEDSNIQSLVVEGQTGSGKTIGYLLPMIESMKYLNEQNKKKLGNEAKPLRIVVATANVALQQQMLESDLPTLKNAGLNVTSRIVVGRGRYLCLRDAADLASNNSGGNLELDDEQLQRTPSAIADRLITTFNNGEWSGIKDDLDFDIPGRVWSPMAANPHTCTNKKCEFADSCPLLADRKEARESDVLITNHSMISAEAKLKQLGVTNSILPDPENTLLVCDEAHHFPDNYRSSQQYNVSMTELADAAKSIPKIKKALMFIANSKYARNFESAYSPMIASARRVSAEIQRMLSNQSFYKFDQGDLPKSFHATIKSELLPSISGALGVLSDFTDSLSSDEKSELVSGESQAHFMLISKIEQLLKDAEDCFNAFINHTNGSARWIEAHPNGQTSFHYSPLNVAKSIKSLILQSYHTTVFASATLRSLGKFSRFSGQMGFSKDDGAQFLLVESPFDYSKSFLRLYRDMPAPNNEEAHTDAVIQQVQNDFSDHQSGLLLFSSKRQMELFVSTAPSGLKDFMKVQYTKPRAQIIVDHKADIDAGKKSLLIGVQSFSEGLDLPGEYLTFVGISKIPFSDHINDPLAASESDYITQKGGSAFMKISLPDASKRLIQSVGRLVRSVNCIGTVAVYDSRLLTKRYGSQLIDALPGFDRTNKDRSSP